ncbi:MAG: hypothetical protein C5B52_01695 [Bacteroidetes bacterium]|nr:MAG: hypothetical protein C5B52_01695 [Bacteroidota bacterium]
MPFTEEEILEQLDLAFTGSINQYFPPGNPDDIKYNFFLDLESGYCNTAGSRIHLFAGSNNWAIVFEKSGYQNRGFSADIELIYVGNCVKYPVQDYQVRNYITNAVFLTLIDPSEFERIQNKVGSRMETFELVGQDITEVKIRNEFIPFEKDYRKYEEVGIVIREQENPNKLIAFEDVLRYLHETDPISISAKDQEIRLCIPKDLPKLLSINDFHFSSIFGDLLPSKHETYQLIAKVLVNLDVKFWKPTLSPNNSWKNWESGHL